MIVIAAVAIYGAALGFSMRPAARAVMFAAFSVAAIQYSCIFLSHRVFDRPGLSSVVLVVQAYAGDQPRDLVPTVATAAFAAALAAFISALGRSGEHRRRVRRVAAIED